MLCQCHNNDIADGRGASTAQPQQPAEPLEMVFWKNIFNP